MACDDLNVIIRHPKLLAVSEEPIATDQDVAQINSLRVIGATAYLNIPVNQQTHHLTIPYIALDQYSFTLNHLVPSLSQPIPNTSLYVHYLIYCFDLPML